VKEMTTNMTRKAMAALLVGLLAATSLGVLATAEGEDNPIGALDGAMPGEDQDLVEGLSSSAVSWQKGIEIIDADSDGNPERMTAAEHGETSANAGWLRYFEVRDSNSDGVVDHIAAYEAATAGDASYQAALEYIDANSDGNPERVEAYRAWKENETRYSLEHMLYIDRTSDGNPERVEVSAVGQYDEASWVATARMLDRTSDGNPESFAVLQAVAWGDGNYARRILLYRDVDSDGHPEKVVVYEGAVAGDASYVGVAGLEDSDSDGNPEAVEALRVLTVGDDVAAAEHFKAVDADSDGHPENVTYGALALKEDAAVAVRTIEILDDDSDGNPESIKAYEALLVKDVAVAARALEYTDADSDGHPENVTVVAFLVTGDVKAAEAAESIKAWRTIEAENGSKVVQAFEYTDADSDGNPERVAFLELGKMVWQDDGVQALASQDAAELPDVGTLAQVEPPTEEALGLAQEGQHVTGLETLRQPWSDEDLRPWEDAGEAVAITP
jgi:hypothetical protein